MREKTPLKLEMGRLTDGPLASDSSDGLAGVFVIKSPTGELRIISSGVDMEYGWEHVSVSLGHRTPLWEEMCIVKDLFWNEDECVVQYHPPKAEYVNHHPHCLHLWKPINTQIPTPPSLLVGPK